MNKSGHLATAVAAGMGSLIFLPSLNASTSLLPAISLIVGAAIGGGAPDFDHKTSTASNMIQFSSKRRQQLKLWSIGLFIIGTFLWAWGKYMIPGVADHLFQVGPLMIGTALICSMMARMRTLVLCSLGIILLWGFYQNDWHILSAVSGIAFLIMPFVKHRGIIHSPEFALLLSYSFWLFGSSAEGILLQAALLGFIIGWWAHMVSDCFGREGISSLFLPKLKIALRLFHNGGHTEKWIARLCWTLSISGCLLLLVRNFNDYGFLSLGIFH